VALKQVLRSLLIVLLVGACIPGRVERPQSSIVPDMRDVPTIKMMADFPGNITGFEQPQRLQVGVFGQRLVDEQVCLQILPEALSDTGEDSAVLPLSIRLDDDEIAPSTIAYTSEGGYDNYCFVPEVNPGLHLFYVELTTPTGVDSYSWEFRIDVE